MIGYWSFWGVRSFWFRHDRSRSLRNWNNLFRKDRLRLHVHWHTLSLLQRQILWNLKLIKILLLHLYKSFLILQNKILLLDHLVDLLFIIFSCHNFFTTIKVWIITILALTEHTRLGLTYSWSVAWQILNLLKKRPTFLNWVIGSSEGIVGWVSS